MDIDPVDFKDRLFAKRDELKRLGHDTADSRRPVELDQSRVGRLSRMDALQGQAMAKETERRRQVELNRIEQALKLIEEGEYGYCRQCGEPIPVRRLDLDPAAVVCVDCAKDAGT